MNLLWQIVYLIVAIYVFLIVPLALFFYEEDEETICCQRVKRALLMEFFFLLFIGLLFGISYIYLSKAKLPVKQTTINFNSLKPGLTMIASSARSSVILSISVSFPIYAISIMSFFGWILFVIFCGVGLTALPMDLILAYKYMPKKISAEEHEARRLTLKKDVDELLTSGNELKKGYQIAMNSKGWFKGMKAKGKIKNEMRMYEAAVIELEYVSI